MMAILLSTQCLAASDPDVMVRGEFKQAYAAPDSTVRSDSAALKKYILYPYLQAARLQQALTQSNRDAASLDKEIKVFLLAQQGMPVARELRYRWLLDLAKRQQWTEFLNMLPTDVNDAELRCWQATAILATQSSDEQLRVLTPLLPALWLSGSRLPPACNAPFDWARSNNLITSALIEQRARMALQASNADLARDLAVTLSATKAEPIRQWAMLIEKPQQAIDALIANPAIKVEDVALQDGWYRLARKDADGAIARFPALIKARGLTAVAASPYAQSVALSLSWSRRSEALAYFAKIQASDKSELGYEWHVRAALWAEDWSMVAQVINAMPETLRTQARWRYWLARAKEQLNDVAKARDLYQSLLGAKDDNYYAAMAAARLGVSYTPNAKPLMVNASVMQQLSVQEAMQRIRELLQVDLRSQAVSEWNVASAMWQRDQQLAAAKLISDWGWHDQAVAVTARMGLYNDYELLYPRPYDAAVNAAAKSSGFSTDLIYAQMRQESLFRADAVSSANARGLLQLLPATARSTARQFKMPAPSVEDLFNPAINVPLGAVHLKSLLERFNGQTIVALAAYNAGPGAARRWLPDRAMDSDVWMENIPYNETRGYVQRILWHSLVFHWLRAAKPLDTQAWLARVSA
ncbi:MAG: transglycosylase SLT domain-containing protein [Steroidobacteraceae bacterium]